MKINKDERNYIMNEVNARLNKNTMYFYTNTDVYKHYKDDIVKAFKETKTYKGLKTIFDVYHIPEKDLKIDIQDGYKNDSSFTLYPAIKIVYDLEIMASKVRYDIFNIAVNKTYVISEKPSYNLENTGIKDIDDIRLMAKIVKAQDIKKGNKAPVIENIINELVNELKPINMEEYKTNALKYIKDHYNG